MLECNYEPGVSLPLLGACVPMALSEGVVQLYTKKLRSELAMLAVEL